MNWRPSLKRSFGDCRAVVLAGLRAEESWPKECAIVNQTPDQLTIVTNQMAALAEELKGAENNPSRREEIATQLIRLGKIYLAIRAGADVAFEDL